MEESGQWLENVDRTNLVLASGKPVLQKEGKHYHQSLLETRINFGVAELASDSILLIDGETVTLTDFLEYNRAARCLKIHRLIFHRLGHP